MNSLKKSKNSAKIVSLNVVAEHSC